MFIKVKTPDNTTVAVNANHVRAIYEVHSKRCNIAFVGEERTLATNMGLDDAIALFDTKPTSNRARKATS